MTRRRKILGAVGIALLALLAMLLAGTVRLVFLLVLLALQLALFAVGLAIWGGILVAAFAFGGPIGLLVGLPLACLAGAAFMPILVMLGDAIRSLEWEGPRFPGPVQQVREYLRNKERLSAAPTGSPSPSWPDHRTTRPSDSTLHSARAGSARPVGRGNVSGTARGPR